MGLGDRLIKLAKKVPIDLGQENVNTVTKGKEIAFAMVPETPASERGKRTAVDVGCRSGHQTRQLEARGYHVTSIDIEKLFDQCIVVDANKTLPFEDKSFDVIWCSEVIEHLADAEFTVGEFRRVLKDGGVMYLTTPNSYFWLMRPLHWIGLPPSRLQRQDHTQFFNIAAIRKIFPNAELFGFFPYMIVKLQIRRMIGPLSPTFIIVDQKGSGS